MHFFLQSLVALLITFNFYAPCLGIIIVAPEQKEIAYYLTNQDVFKNKEALIAEIVIETALETFYAQRKSHDLSFIDILVEKLERNNKMLNNLIESDWHEKRKTFFGVTIFLLLLLGPTVYKTMFSHTNKNFFTPFETLIGMLATTFTFAGGYLYWLCDSKNFLDATTAQTYTQEIDALNSLANIIKNMKNSPKWPILLQKLNKEKISFTVTL